MRMRSMRMYRRDTSSNLASVLELLTPSGMATPQKGAAHFQATMMEVAGELLPGIVAILIILLALSLPVLLILWRLHQSYS